MTSTTYDPNCRRCPRLVDLLADVKSKYPGYHCGPVASFGDPEARLLIVGLAPGLHGANASGRPFTGDHAGTLLYKTLYRYGLSSAPRSVSRDDDLQLHCRLTNAVKCLPPQNRPSAVEITKCNDYLQAELRLLPSGGVVLALGLVAHRAVLKALNLKMNHFGFGHGAVHSLEDGQTLLNSYHCSRYNIQTRRLTETMFQDIFHHVRALLG